MLCADRVEGRVGLHSCLDQEERVAEDGCRTWMDRVSTHKLVRATYPPSSPPMTPELAPATRLLHTLTSPTPSPAASCNLCRIGSKNPSLEPFKKI